MCGVFRSGQKGMENRADGIVGKCKFRTGKECYLQQPKLASSKGKVTLNLPRKLTSESSVDNENVTALILLPTKSLTRCKIATTACRLQKFDDDKYRTREHRFDTVEELPQVESSKKDRGSRLRLAHQNNDLRAKVALIL
jgi:hypothetical protein